MSPVFASNKRLPNLNQCVVLFSIGLLGLQQQYMFIRCGHYNMKVKCRVRKNLEHFDKLVCYSIFLKGIAMNTFQWIFSMLIYIKNTEYKNSIAQGSEMRKQAYKQKDSYC